MKKLEELFNDLYPIKRCVNNPLECAEAIGFVKALEFAYEERREELEAIKAKYMLLMIAFYGRSAEHDE